MRKPGNTYTQWAAEILPPCIFVGLNEEGKVAYPKDSKAVIGVSSRYVPSALDEPISVVQSDYVQIELTQDVEAGDRLKPAPKGRAMKAEAGEMSYLIAQESGKDGQIIDAFIQPYQLEKPAANGGNT